MYTWKYIFCAAGTIILGIYTCLCFRTHGTYGDIAGAADKKIFFMGRFSSPGFYLLDRLNIKAYTHFHWARILFCMYYGEEYGEFGMQCAAACGIASVIILPCAGLFVSVLAGEPFIALFFTLSAALIAVYPVFEVKKQIGMRKNEIMSSFPDVIARLSLLCGAGMVLREALERTAVSSEGVLYDELKLVISEIKNGKTENEALHSLSQRCGIKEISRFASVLSQNISGGSDAISSGLRYMNDEAWLERRNRAKMLGGSASQKLMLPLMLMFIGVLAMIVIPLLAEI